MENEALGPQTERRPPTSWFDRYPWAMERGAIFAPFCYLYALFSPSHQLLGFAWLFWFLFYPVNALWCAGHVARRDPPGDQARVFAWLVWGAAPLGVFPIFWPWTTSWPGEAITMPFVFVFGVVGIIWSIQDPARRRPAGERILFGGGTAVALFLACASLFGAGRLVWRPDPAEMILYAFPALIPLAAAVTLIAVAVQLADAARRGRRLPP